MDATHTTPLGFIGLGRMGAPMASRLLDAGHPLHVFDTSPAAIAPFVARGAVAAASAAAVADRVDTIFLCLPTPSIVQEVTLGDAGVIAGAAVRTVIDLSTTGPAVEKIVAAALRERDVTLV